MAHILKRGRLYIWNYVGNTIETGIAKRDLNYYNNIKPLSNKDILEIIQNLPRIEYYEFDKKKTRIAIKDNFAKNLKNVKNSKCSGYVKKFDEKSDSMLRWILSGKDFACVPVSKGICNRLPHIIHPDSNLSILALFWVQSSLCKEIDEIF